ncbi:MAG TPA: MBL fold metallo-hydrolase [Terriglobia bacterium]|nr:MBL fold metallo-hydrolase [Terriglobia bacterium]
MNVSPVVSQRRFAVWMAIFVAISIFPLRMHCAAQGDYKVQQIAPHTFVWVPDDIMDQNGDPDFNRAVNAGFVITDQGVVVIDTANNPFHAREILYEIRQRTDLPVRLVIDLGPQADQILGNEVFAEQHAVIVSTSAAKALMQSYQQSLGHRMPFDPELTARMRGIHFTLPTQTFTGETTFRMGDKEIRVVSMNCGPPGHDSGDAVVYLPQDRMLFLGDLYVNGYVPQIGSRDITRWITTLGELEKWNAAIFVPGHGEPGSQKDLAAFHGFLGWLKAGVQGGIQQGESLSQVERRLLSSSAFNLRALDLAPHTIRQVYEQLKGTSAAHAAYSGANFSPAASGDRRISVPSGGGL